MVEPIQEAKLTGFPACGSRSEPRIDGYQGAFEENHHRVYSLAFYMSDNELTAEELAVNTFCRAFGFSRNPDADSVDRALVSELRELMPLGTLSLQSVPCSPSGLRRRAKRVELERAVVQLPPTERLIFLLHDVERYEHVRIGRLLGLSERECVYGLHQARLRVRQLLASAS